MALRTRQLTRTPALLALRRRRAAVLLLVGCSAVGCKQKSSDQTAAPVVSADRLRPNEAMLSKVSAFGIPVPKDLRVEGKFKTAVYLGGKANPGDLIDYFRSHVVADHLEIAGTATIFPRVYVKGDTSKRLYRIEITAVSLQYSKVVITDITPTRIDPALTQEQVLEQVGLNADGTLRDRLKLK
jgi:hypothetical protein